MSSSHDSSIYEAFRFKITDIPIKPHEIRNFTIFPVVVESQLFIEALYLQKLVEKTRYMKRVCKQPTGLRMVSMGYTSEVQRTSLWWSVVVVLFILAVSKRCRRDQMWTNKNRFCYIRREVTVKAQRQHLSHLQKIPRVIFCLHSCRSRQKWASLICYHTYWKSLIGKLQGIQNSMKFEMPII